MQRYLQFPLFLLVMAVVGCGGASAPDRSETQNSLNQAFEAFERGEHEPALAAFNAAIERGGLTPDQAVDAYIRRAVSRAHLGDSSGAHADLDYAEQGAPNMDLVLSARARVLTLEGKSAEANAALAKARAINPQVVKFE